MPVAEWKDGLDLDDLEAKLRALRAEGKRARALYAVADFANPSGMSLSIPTRTRLLDIASREQPRKPTLKSLDRTGHVLYLGSFSKSAFPSLRVGYVVADQQVTDPQGRRRLLSEELSKIKSMLSVNTSPLCQAIVAGMLIQNDCTLLEFNREPIRFYKKNMEATLAA